MDKQERTTRIGIRNHHGSATVWECWFGKNQPRMESLIVIDVLEITKTSSQ